MRHTASLFPLALLFAALAGCGITGPGGQVTREDDLVRGTGTVLWYNLEGGFYAILGDDRKTYDPMNLPDSFRRNGLRVYFEARVRGDMGSIHQVGEVVEVLEIRKQ